MRFFKKIIFIYILSNFLKLKKNSSFNDLNFKKLDFTNYKQIKNFIFKKDFYKLNSKNVQSFDFLNFSNKIKNRINNTFESIK